MSQRLTISWERGGALEVIELDATLRETHRMTSQVTQHPVEDGAQVADHLRPDPEGLEIEGIVTDTPLGSMGSGYAERVGAILEGVTTSGIEGLASEHRQQRAWELLRALRYERTLCTVSTSLSDYTAMALTSIGPERDAKRRHSLHVSLAFQRVRIVSSKTVAAPVIERAKPQGDRGRQPTQEVAPARKQSILGKITAPLFH